MDSEHNDSIDRAIAHEALAYMVDCTLATVANMAAKKRRSKIDYQRQIRIAQKGIQYMKLLGVDMSHTRAERMDNYDVEA